MFAHLIPSVAVGSPRTVIWCSNRYHGYHHVLMWVYPVYYSLDSYSGRAIEFETFIFHLHMTTRYGTITIGRTCVDFLHTTRAVVVFLMASYTVIFLHHFLCANAHPQWFTQMNLELHRASPVVASVLPAPYNLAFTFFSKEMSWSRTANSFVVRVAFAFCTPFEIPFLITWFLISRCHLGVCFPQHIHPSFHSQAAYHAIPFTHFQDHIHDSTTPRLLRSLSRLVPSLLQENAFGWCSLVLHSLHRPRPCLRSTKASPDPSLRICHCKDMDLSVLLPCTAFAVASVLVGFLNMNGQVTRYDDRDNMMSRAIYRRLCSSP